MLMEESYERKKRIKMQKEKIVPLYISVTAQCLRSIVESHTPPALQMQAGRLSLELHRIPSPAMRCGARRLETGDRRGSGVNKEFTLAVGIHTTQQKHIPHSCCYFVIMVMLLFQNQGRGTRTQLLIFILLLKGPLLNTFIVINLAFFL